MSKKHKFCIGMLILSVEKQDHNPTHVCEFKIVLNVEDKHLHIEQVLM